MTSPHSIIDPSSWTSPRRPNRKGKEARFAGSRFIKSLKSPEPPVRGVSLRYSSSCERNRWNKMFNKSIELIRKETCLGPGHGIVKGNDTGACQNHDQTQIYSIWKSPNSGIFFPLQIKCHSHVFFIQDLQPMCEPLLPHWGRWSAQNCFSDFVSSGVGIWFSPPPKKRNDNNGFLWNWENLGCINRSEIKPTWIWNIQLKISQNWRYTAVHMWKCWLTSVVVMWFFGHLPGGKDAIYRYPGSPCYGLLRKRQNGGRPEAQKKRILPADKGCGFLSTLFTKMAHQPTSPVTDPPRPY